jgi:hypothetical protein
MYKLNLSNTTLKFHTDMFKIVKYAKSNSWDLVGRAS